MINESELNDIRRRLIDLEASQNNFLQTGSGVALSGDVIITDTIRATNAIIGDTEAGNYLQYTPDEGLSQNWNDGNMKIDGDGINVNDTTFLYKQTATEDSETRQFDMGMFIADGDTKPSAGWQYYKPGSSELVVNGDFATGDFTGWTKTTETNGVFFLDGFLVRWETSDSTNSGVLTSDRMAVTGQTSYNVSVWHYQDPAYSGTSKLEVKWYDDPSSGSLLRTDTIFNKGSENTTHSIIIISPIDAQSCTITWTIINIEKYGDTDLSNISLQAVTVSNKLYFEPTYGNLVMDNAGMCMWATTALITPPQWIVTASDGTTVVSLTMDGNSGAVGYTYWRLETADANDGDRYRSACVLKAGTYDINIYGMKVSSAGMFDVYVDGTKVNGATPFDQYASSTDYDEVFTVSDVSIAKSGNHLVELRVNGKHASSSDYRLYLTMGGVAFVPANVSDF